MVTGNVCRCTDVDGQEMVDCTVRAYLLYLLSCTLFTDKSGIWVPIIFLTQLVGFGGRTFVLMGYYCTSILIQAVGASNLA